MTRINAYLHFNGNCEEAMKFYQDCIGGELKMQTVGESPLADTLTTGNLQRVLYASLTKGALSLMASDMAGNTRIAPGNVISLILICSGPEEIRQCFEKLSRGGKVVFPLSEQFWGATYGELTDKFGINWMLNYEKNPAI